MGANSKVPVAGLVITRLSLQLRTQARVLGVKSRLLFPKDNKGKKLYILPQISENARIGFLACYGGYKFGCVHFQF